jgi:hypothetical protein
MPTADPPKSNAPRDRGEVAARRGARVALAAFVVVSCAFVVSSTWQLTRAVLFPAGMDASTPLVPATSACAHALVRLEEGVFAGLRASEGAHTEEEAAATFEASTAPVWDGPDGEARAESLCATEVRGEDAVAAVERMRRAARGVARGRARDLAEVRRDVSIALGQAENRGHVEKAPSLPVTR